MIMQSGVLFLFFFRDVLAFTLGATRIGYIDAPQQVTNPTTAPTLVDLTAFDSQKFEEFVRALKESELAITVTETPESSPRIPYVPFDENVTLDASSTDNLATGIEMSPSTSMSLRNRYGVYSAFPTPVQLPVSEFCKNVPYGSYGNPNYRCQVYHVCQDFERADTMPCPGHLRFSDDLGICDWPDRVDENCKGKGAMPVAMHFRHEQLPITFDYTTPNPVDSFKLDILLRDLYGKNSATTPSSYHMKVKAKSIRFPHWRQVGTYNPGPNFPRQPFVHVSYPVYLGYKKLRKRLPGGFKKDTPL